MSTADFSSKAVRKDMTRSTGKLDLRPAERVRVTLTAQQQKSIEQLYKDAAKDIATGIKTAPDTVSGAMRSSYLKGLKGDINENLKAIQEQMSGTIKTTMGKVADAVCNDNLKFLKSVGMPIQGAFSHVPDDVVRSILTGQIYKGKWSFSEAIWGATRKAKSDIDRIIALGVAENKSTLEIARDLEKYVDPKARKPWDWNKVYPGVSTKIDYNAQRLARTLVSHAYQQSFIKATQKNPFVTEYEWLSSGGERMCEICAARDGVRYSKNDLPMDHPNGMCTFIAVIDSSMEDIADRIADWALGGADQELDRYARTLRSGH